MLHILWMIIKFILIVLGILLGLIFLAVLLLLFCPIRYRAVVTKEEKGLKAVRADAKVSWLFGLIGFHVAYKEGKPKISFRILGIPFEKIKVLLKKKKNKESSATEITGKNKAKGRKGKAGKHQKQQQPNKAAASADKNADVKAGQVNQKQDLNGTGCNGSSDDIKRITESPENHSYEEEKSGTGLFSRILGILKTIFEIPFKLVKFLMVLPGKIQTAVRKIWVTIQNICGKIGWWKSFLGDEHTKAVISLIKERVGILLRHILPTKVTGNVTFGFEDPSTTGMILGVLGMSFPLHKNRIAVTPLFDGENHLTGKVFLKGRIYGIVLVIAAVKIYFNKNTKYVIHRWKTRDMVRV